MENTITVKAHYVPQVWINDYAMDLEEGTFEFEVTLTIEEAKQLLKEGDDSYATDFLLQRAPEGGNVDHPGPFKVLVCTAIINAFEEMGYPYYDVEI